ncbi:hypothetical protein R3P38DRAFT_2788578 [Favolaschia claudopus]|uniref:Uncharacterized protein n=1 Tax=Favolaschia claudopus TaxID=2862362 RepID=A0AAW0AJY8_9AGAR
MPKTYTVPPGQEGTPMPPRTSSRGRGRGRKARASHFSPRTRSTRKTPLAVMQPTKGVRSTRSSARQQSQRGEEDDELQEEDSSEEEEGSGGEQEEEEDEDEENEGAEGEGKKADNEGEEGGNAHGSDEPPQEPNASGAPEALPPAQTTPEGTEETLIPPGDSEQPPIPSAPGTPPLPPPTPPLPPSSPKTAIPPLPPQNSTPLAPPRPFPSRTNPLSPPLPDFVKQYYIDNPERQPPHSSRLPSPAPSGSPPPHVSRVASPAPAPPSSPHPRVSPAASPHAASPPHSSRSVSPDRAPPHTQSRSPSPGPNEQDKGGGGDNPNDLDLDDMHLIKPGEDEELIAPKFLSTHAARNPNAVQLPKKPRGTGVPTEESSKQAKKRKHNKNAKEGAEEEVEALYQRFEEGVAAISERWGLTDEEVRKMARSGSNLKTVRYNERAAKMWLIGQEVKTGGDLSMLHQLVAKDNDPEKWTAEARAELKEKYLAMRAEEQYAVRPTNAAAAKDTTTTGEKLDGELQKLSRRTGAIYMLLIAPSAVTDTIQPAIWTSAATAKFVPEVLKMPADRLPQLLGAWARGTLDEPAKELKGQSQRAAMTAIIKDGLNAMFGASGIEMQWRQYEVRVRACMGVELAGWPANMPVEALSNMGQRGAENIRELHTLHLAGTLKWRDVPKKEHEALLEKYPKARDAYEKTWKPKRDEVRAAERVAEAGGKR